MKYLPQRPMWVLAGVFGLGVVKGEVAGEIALAEWLLAINL